ncbi:hypothetical protein E2C01_049014 [Portunus trituberculatus]|uniref:Uncharacterized protein n=1 Tax=Portunus trituberculatus TaxID=210409 RepID=A0A5B7G545_PORTR|nr:hypothetical protein [Portunus trituberculatus]
MCKEALKIASSSVEDILLVLLMLLWFVVLTLLVGEVCGPPGLLNVLVLVAVVIDGAVLVELSVQEPPLMLEEEVVVMVAVVRVAVELTEFVSPFPPMLTVTVTGPLPLLHRKLCN